MYLSRDKIISIIVHIYTVYIIQRYHIFLLILGSRSHKTHLVFDDSAGASKLGALAAGLVGRGVPLSGEESSLQM